MCEAWQEPPLLTSDYRPIVVRQKYQGYEISYQWPWGYWVRNCATGVYLRGPASWGAWTSEAKALAGIMTRLRFD